MTYQKTINPAYEVSGKRPKLTGFIGELYDGNILLHSQEYSTNSQAEQALDRIVFDLLTDLRDQGLVDDVPAACEAENVSSTHLPSWVVQAQQSAAERPAAVMAERCACGVPAAWEVAYVIAPHYEYFCADHLPPDLIAEPVTWPAHICTVCSAPHHTWQCPETGNLLFELGPCIGTPITPEPVVMVDAVDCQAPDCIQFATHDDQYCCYHYSEEVTGIPCDCTDDEYEDAMWESAHGSYGGQVPTNYEAMRQFSGAMNMSDMESDHVAPIDVEFAPVGWAA